MPLPSTIVSDVAAPGGMASIRYAIRAPGSDLSRKAARSHSGIVRIVGLEEELVADRKEIRRTGRLRVGQLFQRADVVENEDAAPVRCGHEIVDARLNGEVPDRHARNAALQLRPVPAAVDGEEHAEIGADKEQIGLPRMLANHLRRGAAGRSPVIEVQVWP